MTGAVLARGGKPILALQSTARDGTVSRFLPFLCHFWLFCLRMGKMKLWWVGTVPYLRRFLYRTGGFCGQGLL